MRGRAKRIVVELFGWLLVVAGIAALVLPGPGLLLLAGGLITLSQQYEWAERRVEPVKNRAIASAAQGVETWPRVIGSLLGVAFLAACSVLWVWSPSAPSWWPVDDRWWLYGGPWTGVTLGISAVAAMVLVVWAFRRFHGHPELVDQADAIADHD